MYRGSITAVHGINSGTQQTRSKLACTTPLKKIQKLPNNGNTSNAKRLLQFTNFFMHANVNSTAV